MMGKTIIITIIVALIFMVGATMPQGYSRSDLTEFFWYCGDTAKGNMTVDSCVTTRACTTRVVTNQFGADSVLFHLYVNAGDTTGTPDTTNIVAQGLDRWGNVIDTSLLVTDTLNDAAVDNLFTVWNTKVTYWPFMRLLRTTIEDTTSTGYQKDSVYGVFYPLKAR